MADLTVKFPCTVCDGTGTVMEGQPGEQSEVPCGNCNGDGSTQEAIIVDSADFVDKINDNADKLDDIWEALPQGWKN